MLAIVIAALVVLLAVAAQQTVIAIDDDLADAQRSLPDIIWGLLSALAGLGVVMLPLVAAVSMLVRRRGRQLLESIAAMTHRGHRPDADLHARAQLRLRDPLRRAHRHRRSATTSPTRPTPCSAGLVAFVTVARLMSRPRWNVVTGADRGLDGASSDRSARAAPAPRQALSFLVGLAVGLLTRYALGTPTTRPSGADVATTLITAGIPLVMLRARGGTYSGRHYMAVKADGEHLDVVVLDRDLEGSGLALALWRTIRLREANDSASGLSMRSQLDRAAMMAYAAQAAGVPSPRLELAAMVSADSALLAYESRDGRAVIPGSGMQSDRPTDEELDIAWRAVAAMQARFLAHQNLHAENVLYAGAGTYLTGLESGTVAAGDVVLRLDVAELLVTQALQTDVPTAVASARRVIGDEAVLRALPVLQRVALSSPTRAALRADKDLLNDLRAELLTINPAVEIEPIDLERLKPRTVVTLILGTVAGYLLLSQLAQVNVAEVIADRGLEVGGRGAGAVDADLRGGDDEPGRLRARPAELPAHPAGAVRGQLRHAGVAADAGRGGGQRPVPEPLGPAPGGGCGHGRGLPGGRVHRARDPDAARRPSPPARRPTCSSTPRAGSIIGVGHRRDDHRRAGLDLARAPLADRPDPADDRAGHPPAGDRGPATREARRGVRRDPAAQRGVLPVPGGLGAGVLRRPDDRGDLVRVPGRVDAGPGRADAGRVGRRRGGARGRARRRPG